MEDHAEDLIDYEEDEETVHNVGADKGSSGMLGLDAHGGDAEGNLEGKESELKKDKKGSYVGIHSTGFRDFLLKPELLRAIVDCGFEHPSEGRRTLWNT